MEEGNVQELFSRTAQRCGDRVAAEHLGGSVTYAELEERSNKLASFLLSRGASKGTVVAILSDDSIAITTAIIGALKADCVFVPLEPAMPDNRLKAMTAVAAPEWFLVDSKYSHRLAEIAPPPEAGQAHVVQLDGAQASNPYPARLKHHGDYAAYDDTRKPPVTSEPDDVCYLYFTSGSTGRPKAIAGRLKGIDHFIRWEIKTLGLGEGVRVSQLIAPTFDAFLRDIFVPLCAGGRICVPPSRDTVFDGRELVRWIDERRVTLIHCVPSLFRSMLNEELRPEQFSSLKYILLSGEPLLPSDVRKWADVYGDRTRLINLYGPSETTMTKFFYFVEPSDKDAPFIPIGKPMEGAKALVVGENGKPCRAGTVGEIYIRTPFRTHGYYKQPELTKEVFVQNPFGGDPEDIVYKTGDLARMLADGNFEFLGRKDQQVKIRGVRIELKEIENLLLTHEAVKDVAVVDREDAPGDRYLCAYLVLGSKVEPGALREFLSSHLPALMIPSAFVEMESLPRTFSGKCDRNALPAPDRARRARHDSFVAARTATEETVAAIWKEVLGVEQVSVNDDFFDLGGHSLIITKVLSRVGKAFQVELPLRTLFEVTTVAALAARIETLRDAGREGGVRPLLPVAHEERDYALSFAQQRLWFFDQLEPGSTFYNLPLAARFSIRVDAALLRRSLNEIVRRHESLRTSFRVVDGLPVQDIAPSLTLDVPVDDLRGLAADEREAEARRLGREEAERPFDLTRAPLIRARLLRLGDEDDVVLVTMHHIVSDNWSINILLQEMSALYAAFSEGRPSPLPELSVQYADFAHWQRRWLQGEVEERQLAYWKGQLAGAPSSLELPTDHPRPAAQTFRGGRQELVLPKDLSDALASLGRREGVSLFMLLLTVFNVLLSRYTGQSDICVGTPTAGRNRLEVENLIGFFVNTLVLRTDLSGNPSFRELLARVRETCLSAYANQDVPFEKLVEELQPERSMSRVPLFQVMFVFQNAQTQGLEAPGAARKISLLEERKTTFDLTLGLAESPGGLVGLLDYSADLYEGESIERMLKHFRVLLGAVVSNPSQRLSELPLLTDEERRFLLHECNDTAAETPTLTLPQLFARQVAQTPDATALIYKAERLTYSELNARANRLARRLRSLGVGAESVVGVLMRRSTEMVVALLGALKAGAAYVPLDANLPAERLSYMLEDAGVEVLLTGGGVGDVGDAAANGVRVVRVEAGETEAESGEEFEGEADGQNIAYVIYTSGSTGRPKGVMISHQAVCNTLLWRKRAFSLSEGDRILQNIPFTFDPSVWQIFGALISGATLVLVEPEGHQDSAHLVEQLAREEITVADFAPSMLQVVLEQKGLEGCGKLRCVFSGGEALPVNLPQRFYSRLNADLFNQYGPTEAAIDAAYWKCEREGLRQTIPIGRPIANKQIYLLDAHLQPVPVGAFGELHIGGMGLARGYLRNPALTAEKFIPNPFARQAGERLYRTGDLARFLPGGEIEFHGRVDNQVKIRGHRIELGEIEAALGKHHALREGVVAVRGDASGEKKLVAYLVAADAAHAPSVNELRSYLKAKLPEYMLPSSFVVMDNLPRMSSGKVNREALPAPDGGRPALEGEVVAAGTPVEEVLCGVWRELLGLRQVGVHDNFFELGGHSLLATQAVSRVREVFSVELPLRRIFESPTVAELAADVESLLKHQDGFEVAAIVPVPRAGEAPLSFAQQRLWFLDRLHPHTSAYNISVAVRLTGRLRLAALKQTLDEIVRRHEVLRTSFTTVDEQPVSVIHPPLSLPLPVADLSHFDADALEEEVSARAAAEAQLPFDLTRPPLLRAGVLKLGEEEHVALLTMHHIASDGWSMGVLLREVAALYEAYTREQPSPLAELPLQYADYAVWQRGWMRGEVLETQVAYWRRRLEGAPPLLELPTDRPRPLVYSYRGAVELLHLPSELSASLKGLSQRRGVTLFMTLLAAFQVLLARYTGQEDVLVGTPVAGRGRAELEGLIGFFVNTLVLRTDLSGDPPFNELLRRVRDVALGAYTHQDVPFERLVEELRPERDLGWHPLFQVMMVMQNAPMGALELPELTLSSLPSERGTAKFDLTLSLLETDGGLAGSLEYSTDLFEAETIRRMLGHYKRLLEDVAAHPERRLSELELLTTGERERVLTRWNETRAARDETSLTAMFERQVERTPDAPAAEFAGRQLSYRELNRRANQLARHLRSSGVGADARVGVCVERGLEMVTAVLGVLKAGGAYVPLDPAYPSERLSFMLADAECVVLLTGERLAASLPETGASVLCLDRDWGRVAGESGEDLCARIRPDGLAYVIYTSGSTGRPKGVAMTHRALNNLICWQLAELPYPARTLQFASLSFDVSFQEMFSTWCSGGTLLLVDDELRRDANSMLRFLSEQQVERIFLPFVYLQHLAEAHANGGPSPVALREVVTAGERLEITPQIANLCGRLRCRLHNHYGPSETHVVTAHTLSGATGGWPALPPIGRPIANTQIYILDGSLRPSPIGVVGELCIGGTNVPRGYLNRPGLTAEKFIPDPFGDERGARLYRTGDSARYLSDGRIEFLGRLDTQVKVRGFRIELGEVESVLSQHTGVRQAVVVVREDEGGAQRLVAYVVAQEAGVSVGELRHFVAGKLPDYMAPSAFVVLDEFPLTPSGKIDRRALPAPGHARDDSRGAYVAPRDHLELQLVHLWEDLLGIRPVGTTDNFFELGGHSFITLRLMGQVKKRFGQDVPLASFFRGPTIRQLASILRDQNEEVSQSPLVLIQPAGTKPPFFCVHEITGSVLRYTLLAQQLGTDQPVYALQTPRFGGGRESYQAVEEMAADYLKAVRDVQPEGPYRLGGWSFGGIVAFEMAQQLERDGHEVGLLAMFDAAAPQAAGTEEGQPDEINLLVGLTSLNNVTLSEELLRRLDTQGRVSYVLEQLRRAGGAAPLSLDESQLQSMLEGARINLRARARYVPRPYPKRITLFRAEEALPHDAADPRFKAFQDPALGWGGLSHEPVEVHPIPGNHFTLFVEPHVQVLANRLKACLQESQACDLGRLQVSS